MTIAMILLLQQSLVCSKCRCGNQVQDSYHKKNNERRPLPLSFKIMHTFFKKSSSVLIFKLLY